MDGVDNDAAGACAAGGADSGWAGSAEGAKGGLGAALGWNDGVEDC